MGNLQDFANSWCHPNHSPVQVSATEISELELELGVSFPEDYRSGVISCGLPHPTTKLWDWLSEEDMRLGGLTGPLRPHLSEFYSPDEIREALGWVEAGMPKDLIPFASDSAGNKICFSRAELERHAKSAVYFWDHDFLETEQQADSFTEWLKLYVPAK
jgi:cell wall assembly regulator SMI1